MGRIGKAVTAVAGLLGMSINDMVPLPPQTRTPSAGLRWHPQSDPDFEDKLRRRLDPDNRVEWRLRDAAETKRARKRARNKAYGLGGWRIA